MTRGGTLSEHRRLIRALEQQSDRAGLLAHGPGYVSALLLSYDCASQAIDHVAALVELDPGFALDLPSSQLQLIEAARLHGHPALVENLVAAYLGRWPAAPGGTQARLIACEAAAAAPGHRAKAWFAELIRRDLNDDERARVRAIATTYVARSGSDALPGKLPRKGK